MNHPTLKDVARRAGVSVSTVSYALNEASTLPLAAATKDRVRRIAREMGYVPNGLARSLQSQASRTIGVVLGKPLTSRRYAAIVEGLARGLDARGHHLALLAESSALAAVDEVRARRLDGLVFIGHDDQGVPDDLAAAVEEYSVPFVAVDCGTPDAHARSGSVDFDYAAGVRQAFAYLASLGVRTVLYVRPDIESRAERMREDAIADERMRHPEIVVTPVSTGVTVDALARLDAEEAGWMTRAAALSARVAQALDEAGSPPSTAVLCAWGTDAEPAYQAARRHDERVRVVALAAGALSDALWPRLAYSRLPLETCGGEAGRLIVAAAAGEDAAERVLLVPELATED
ncbi:LacI family transcriptional regulator [Microbacterium sp. LRZ72]|uniref:LacI family DNA-binding transcriptional regulator n=1 Tax=Microbacterium sp. LRZ72 TaxID=2942481 RepID=UPI0029A8F54C|nr:LacI family DNA-binding transcriptional regulator [Microbacterium sp. LRZ72]MDX2376458.1 LacI family transcriptional regulator [Microbacterium sp. LRZ72]